MFFANAENFERRALAALDQEEQPVRWFVLNTEAISEIDLTGADALESLRQRLVDRRVVFALARLKYELRQSLEAAGFLDMIGENRIFMTLPTVVEAYQRWSDRRQGQASGHATGPNGTTLSGVMDPVSVQLIRWRPRGKQSL